MRHVVIYFLLACGISWLIWLPLYAPVLGINGLPILPYHHAWGAYGPIIAAFVCTYVFDRAHAGRLKRSMFRFSLPYLGIALLAPFVIAILASVANSIFSGNPLQLEVIGRSNEFPQWSILLFSLYNLFTFGMGEEAGWRGYALPKLQSRFKPLYASLLLTVFWALWHVPLFLYRPGYVSMDAAGIAGWVFSLATGGILLTWLFNASRGSVLVCAVFHATIDVAFTSAYADSNVVSIMGALVTIWGILMVVAFRRMFFTGIIDEGTKMTAISFQTDNRDFFSK